MPGQHCCKLFTGVTAFLVAMSALGSTQAFAQEKSAAADESGLFRLDIGIGLKGGLTGAWALEVPENPAYKFNDESKSYYSAFGLGGDFGLMLDARALDRKRHGSRLAVPAHAFSASGVRLRCCPASRWLDRVCEDEDPELGGSR